MDNAFILLAFSVLMHVAWNLMARYVDKRANFLWWGLLAHTLIFGPWAFSCLLTEVQWNQTLVLAMLCSALANAFYFFALRQAYHHGSVSFVYPVARSSPILIALWAWLLFGNVLGVIGLAGILLSILGLWLLASSDRSTHTASALKWSGLAALGTSVYSISDKAAVSYLPSFGAQLGFISVGYLTSFIVLTVLQYKESDVWIPKQRPSWIYVLLGGAFIGVAYALVVRAMQDLPAASVVAITNSGIVLASLLSIVVFKEKVAIAWRLLSSVIISAGIALVVLDV